MNVQTMLQTLKTPRWTVLLILFLVVVVLPLFHSIDVAPDQEGLQSPETVIRLMDVAVLVMVYIIMALALNLVCGDMGLLDLGFVAFVIIGAYTTALLYRLPMFQFPGAWVVILLISGLHCALWGWLRGLPSLHLTGDYYAIVTFAFAQIAFFVALNETELTGGSQGLRDYPAITMGYEREEVELTGAIEIPESLGLVISGKLVINDEGEPDVVHSGPARVSVKKDGTVEIREAESGYRIEFKGEDLPYSLTLKSGDVTLNSAGGLIGSWDPFELKAASISALAEMNEADQHGVHLVIPSAKPGAETPFTVELTLYPAPTVSFSPGHAVFVGPDEKSGKLEGQERSSTPKLEYVGKKYLFYSLSGGDGVTVQKRADKFESQRDYKLEWTTRSHFDTIVFDFDREVYHFIVEDKVLGPGAHTVTLNVRATMPDGVVLESSPAFYYIVLLFTVMTMFVMIRIQQTRMGRAFFAIKANAISAKSSGIDLAKYKMIAFGVSAFFGGIGGGLLAFKFEILSPNVFTFWLSVIVLCCAVLGGLGSVPGVVLGTVALMSLGEVLRERVQIDSLGIDMKVPEQARFLAFGAILILIMLFRSQGLFPPIGRRRKTEAEQRELLEGANPYYTLGRGSSDGDTGGQGDGGTLSIEEAAGTEGRGDTENPTAGEGV
jgi:ABC-type branched-subunit amino acid transport system permease subunit